MEQLGDELGHRPATRAVRQVDTAALEVELAAVCLQHHAAPRRARSRKRP
jgi:hypothetical protein